jgi:hypothetical protein
VEQLEAHSLEDVALNAKSFAALGQQEPSFWARISAHLAAQPLDSLTDRCLQLLYPVLMAHSPAGSLAGVVEDVAAGAAAAGGASSNCGGSSRGGGRGDGSSSEGFVPDAAFETMLEGIPGPGGPLSFVSQAQQLGKQQEQPLQHEAQQQAEDAQLHAEEPATPRKRGRPKKIAAADAREAQQQQQQQQSAAGDAAPSPGSSVEAPAPRKRGRPRKQPAGGAPAPVNAPPSGLQLPEALQRASRDAWRRASVTVVSDLHSQVAQALRKLGLAPQLEHLDPACLISLDIVVTLPSGLRVAVEVDGPEHFSRNKPHRRESLGRAPAAQAAADGP